VQSARAAAVLYVLLNWVGQDYLSPQAVGFVLYLAIMCCVLVVFPGDPSDTRRWQRRWLHPRSRPGAGSTARGQERCLLGLTVLAAVGVTAHQLTPGFLAASLILLGLLNQTRLRALGWSVVLMTAGWLGYAAEVFWRGQLNKVVGSFVQVDVLVQENLGKRTGGSAGREVVVAGRLGLALVLAAATLVALVVLWRRRDVPVALATLVAAPIPVLLAAAYGGEMALRVFFFALPAASLLVAQVACPEGMWTVTRRVIVSAALVALVPLFVLARFGNESFEQVTPQDREILSTVYDVAPDNSIVYQLNSISIQRLERLDEVRFRTLDSSLDAKALTETVADSEPFAGRFIMVTHSQEEQGVELGGESPGWSAEIVAELLATGSFETVRRDGDAVLLRYIGSTG
ncbi:MAG: hypothetical protein M3513_14785, partial [Actinomycetota bacterium]|nr:hypothetical protein [Actinomycetota bacterium]